jgi:hypothetical protein
MASRYTDVDQMIFKRWDDVQALRAAFDDLVDRMREVVEGALQTVSTTMAERGLQSEVDLKRPFIALWKPTWVTPRNREGLYFQVADFVPADYGKAVEECPSVRLITKEFSSLKMRETSEEFGRAVRDALPPELRTKWIPGEHLPDAPLGHDYAEVSDADRVRFVSEPGQLVKFIADRVDEFMELVPSIDQALQRMTRR